MKVFKVLLHSKFFALSLLLFSFLLTGCVNNSNQGVSIEKQIQDSTINNREDDLLLIIKENDDTSIESIEKDLNSLDSELDLNIKIDDLEE